MRSYFLSVFSAVKNQRELLHIKEKLTACEIECILPFLLLFKGECAMSITIAGRAVGAESPVFIIAEASSNHGRDLEKAKKMIEVAAWAGADAIKFQLFSAEKIAADTDDPRTIVRADEKAVFVKKNSKLIDLYRPNELPRAWLPELSTHAKVHGIIFFASPFDEEAVDQLERISVPAYKIASYELLDVPLLRKVAATQKPVILSTGMANLGEIEFALHTLRRENAIVLQCTSTYPAPPENVNLAALRTLQLAFPHCVIGFSDHSLGTAIPVAATALGAKVLEKHFFLDDGFHTVDDQFSLTPAAFKEMIAGIRTVEKALGSSAKRPSALEEREKIQARRSLWAIKEILSGEAITPQNVACLRPGIGLSPQHYDLIMGKKAIRPIRAQTPLEWEDLLKLS
jgi:sialic acid synthase SpsE